MESEKPPEKRPRHLFKPGAEWTGNRKGRPRKAETIQKVKITWDVKQLAKEVSREAIETLVEIMRDKTTGAAVRANAANAILDRGYGKPQQVVEANVSVFDRMSDHELLQYIMGDVIEGAVLEGAVLEETEMLEHYEDGADAHDNDCADGDEA